MIEPDTVSFKYTLLLLFAKDADVKLGKSLQNIVLQCC